MLYLKARGFEIGQARFYMYNILIFILGTIVSVSNLLIFIYMMVDKLQRFPEENVGGGQFDTSTAPALINTLSDKHNRMTNESPEVQAVRNHLESNVTHISLEKLRDKKNYMKLNICVDGREDGEGIPGFAGFAGKIGASIPAAKEVFDGILTQDEIYSTIKEYIGDNRIYAHDDTHTRHHHEGASYADCKAIGCGAIKYMQDPNNAELYGLNEQDRTFIWKLIDTNADVKVLDGDHLEKGIISIENTVRKNEDDKLVLDTVKGNTHPITGEQYFAHHVTGGKEIIKYISEDLAETFIRRFGENRFSTLTAQTEASSDQAIAQLLEQAISKWSNIHAGATLSLLAPAKKLADAGQIYTATKLSRMGDNEIA